MSQHNPVNFAVKGSRALRKFADASSKNTSRKFFYIFNPMYILAFLFCLPLLSLPLTTQETNIIELNIKKYHFVFWVSFLFSLIAYYGVSDIPKEQVGALVTALLVPTLITGSAWFSITLGGVQENLLVVAMSLTKWMFTGFLISLITMLIVLAAILPAALTLVFAGIIFLLVLSAITYDNVDCLKIGLDDTLRRHSLTALAKLGDDGYWPPLDTDQELKAFMDKSNSG